VQGPAASLRSFQDTSDGGQCVSIWGRAFRAQLKRGFDSNSVLRAASNDNLFGGTSVSIAGPAPSGAAIAARGRGAGRHVRLPCPVECPHAYAPPRGPAPPPPVLCRGRTHVTRHPHSGSARRVASTGAGRRRGPRRSQARRSTHGREVVSFHCETAVARHQTRVRLGFTCITRRPGPSSTLSVLLPSALRCPRIRKPIRHVRLVGLFVSVTMIAHTLISFWPALTAV